MKNFNQNIFFQQKVEKIILSIIMDNLDFS